MTDRAAVICSVLSYENINLCKFLYWCTKADKVIIIFFIVYNTFSLVSLFDSCFDAVSLDSVNVADVSLTVSKGASYSNTVPINLLDSSFTKPSFCLNKRRGS